MTNNKNQPGVFWLQVWGIAAIQGAITLSWVIYNMYLPGLLVQLGFAAGLAKVLLIVENALEAVIEPTFGGLSDRQQRLIGSRLPLISVGVILSSALFIAIPAVVIFGNLRWLLPGLAVLWASAMAVFRSPAMSLLGRSAPTDKLPQAASILTLVGGLIGSFRFDTYGIILKLGPAFAFAIGSVTLLAAAAALRFVHPPEPPTPETTEPAPISFPILGLILGAGISVGWGLRFLIPTISMVLAQQLSKSNHQLAMMGFFIGLGLVALPAGKLAVKLGNSKAMLIGLGTIVVFLQLLAFIPNGVVVGVAVVVLFAAFSLVLNGAVPFVLGLVPAQRVGLGVGMYFGGFGGAISLFEFVFSQLTKMTPTIGAIGGAIAFLAAALCIALSMGLQKNK
ncbi:MAG: MFS transporter [Xenococcaceae cyanobacterium]